MTARKILSGTATLAAFIFAMAAFLAVQDTSAYPSLDYMPFWGWLLISAGIVTAVTIPGLAILGILILVKWLLTFSGRPESEPSPPNTPAPAASSMPDINAEWADVEAEIKEGSR